MKKYNTIADKAKKKIKVKKNDIKIFVSILVVIILLTLSFIFYWENMERGKSTDSWDNLKSKSSLNVGVFTNGLASTTYINENGEWDGFHTQIIKKFAENESVKLNFIEVGGENGDISEITQQLKEGKLDCFISDYCITKTREENMIFSLPTVDTSVALAVKNNIRTTEISNLHGLKVGYVGDSFSETCLNNISSQYIRRELDLVTYPGLSNLMFDLFNGKVDGAFSDEIHLKSLEMMGKLRVFKDSSGNPLRIGKTAQYAFSFPLQSNIFRNKINEIILHLASDGQLKKLSIEYLGEDYISEELDVYLNTVNQRTNSHP